MKRSNRKRTFHFNSKESVQVKWLALLIIIPLLLLLTRWINLGWKLEEFILLLVLLSPLLAKAYLYGQYYLVDGLKEVEIDRGAKQILVIQNGQQFLLSKDSIQECTLVYTANYKLPWHSFQYLRIKLNERQGLVITHLLVKPAYLLQILQIHCQHERVFFPSVDERIPSERQWKKQRQHFEEQKIEFISLFNAYETEKLQQIIAEDQAYASYAVEAAKEIVKTRQSSSANTT